MASMRETYLYRTDVEKSAPAPAVGGRPGVLSGKSDPHYEGSVSGSAAHDRQSPDPSILC